VGCPRVLQIEFSNLVISMDSIIGCPAAVSNIIAFPFDEVLELSPAEVAVEDLFNLIFLVSSSKDWWRRGCWMTSWNWIWLDKGQLDNREDWVQFALIGLSAV
jgi:hypothetical protein